MTAIQPTALAPDARPSDPALSVDSEVGQLRRVIVHRPGAELARLTPENRDELLFDDVVWVQRAQQEHDAFTEALRSRSVGVLYLDELLAQTLEQEEVRESAVEATLAQVQLGPRLRAEIAAWLISLPVPQLTTCLIAGITLAELPFRGTSLVELASRPDAFVLPPLPNQMFTRDSSAWLFGGVSIHTMARAARRREALHVDLIYRHHPLFASSAHSVWSEPTAGAPALEGGDILVIAPRQLLIGLSERSGAAAVEAYAARLFETGAADRIIAVTLPDARSSIHLDTVLTMVDTDACTFFSGLRDQMRTFVLEPGDGVRVREERDLFPALADALGVERMRVIESEADRRTAAREQWDEGNNVLAISPGVVVAYERNAEINARLRAEGVEVIPIPSSELARGRGGPRCMTCPIQREPIGASSDPPG